MPMTHRVPRKGKYFLQEKDGRSSCWGGRGMGRARRVSDRVRRNNSASRGFIAE